MLPQMESQNDINTLVSKKDCSHRERDLTAEGGGFKDGFHAAYAIRPSQQVKPAQQKGAAAVVPIHVWASTAGNWGSSPTTTPDQTPQCVECVRAKRKPMKAGLGTCLCWACMVELGVTLDNEDEYTVS